MIFPLTFNSFTFVQNFVILCEIVDQMDKKADLFTHTPFLISTKGANISKRHSMCANQCLHVNKL